MKAKYLFELKTMDPDTGGVVTLEVYKHENGGLFALDSSFIEASLEEELIGALPDPFVHGGVINIQPESPTPLVLSFMPKDVVIVDKGTEEEIKGIVSMISQFTAAVKVADDETLIVSAERLTKA